jgi:AAA15 family ATPase/GTPase
MLKKLYVDNFRTLQDFEINFENNRNLIYGENSTGKTNIIDVLTIFRKIKDWPNITDLISINDFSFNKIEEIMKFGITVLINKNLYVYSLHIKVTEDQIQICHESLEKNSVVIFLRFTKEIKLLDNKTNNYNFCDFKNDMGLVLPTLSFDVSIKEFLEYLHLNLIVIKPEPKNFLPYGADNLTVLNEDCSNIVGFIRSILSNDIYIYSKITDNLSKWFFNFSGFEFIKNDYYKSFSTMNIIFKNEESLFKVKFSNLSNGDKMFFLFSLINSLCYLSKFYVIVWDEIDNYFSKEELKECLAILQECLNENIQIILTTNDKETSSFFESKIFELKRKSYLDKTVLMENKNGKY